MTYAEGTAVPVEKSRIEIEMILRRYGAEAFRSGWAEQSGARMEVIEFVAQGRGVRFSLPMPAPDEARFTMDRNKPPRERPAHIARQRWEQGCRERWRSLVLCVKAKLEAVASGITTFDEEFLAHVVDPMTGHTIGETLAPQLGQLGKARLIGLPAPAPDQGGQ